MESSKMRNSVLGVAFGVLAALMVSAETQAATIWNPTDSNVNIIVFPGPRPSLNGGDLAWFANEAALAAATPSQVIGADGGIFSPTPGFVLGVTWDGGASYVGDIFIRQALGDPTSWFILFRDGADKGLVWAADLVPVPLPTAALFFASALIGLAGIKRRKA
jgi:hypothetical protein